MTPTQEALLLATTRTLRALLTHQAEATDATHRRWPERHECVDYLAGLDDALAPFQGDPVAVPPAAPPPMPDYDPSAAIFQAIWAERWRQISGCGYDYAHDDAHARGEIALAAAAYAIGSTTHRLQNTTERGQGLMQAGFSWPWEGGPSLSNARADLIRAAALIVAELERLDRAGAT